MSDDVVNNRRVRQLIEQFNAEEAYEYERRSLEQEWQQLAVSGCEFPTLISALRKILRRLPKPPTVNAVGLSLEN